MIVDIQQHLAPPTLVEAMREHRPQLVPLLTGNAVDLEPRLEEMNAASIDVGLLSIPLPARLDRGDGDSGLVALARGCNDELLAAAGRHPGRFGVLVTLPFPDADACVAELERVARHELVCGVIAFAATEQWSLDLPELEPVYEKAARLGLPVMIHPALDSLTALPVFGPYWLSASMAPMVETSVVTVRLMLSGVLDRVPGLTPIVPHLGGVLPYLAQRLVDQSGTGNAEHDCLEYLRTRCLLDSCSFHTPALACAVDTVTAERVLLGSDYPFRGSLARAVADIQDSGLDKASQSAILGSNASRHGLVVPAA